MHRMKSTQIVQAAPTSKHSVQPRARRSWPPSGGGAKSTPEPSLSNVGHLLTPSTGTPALLQMWPPRQAQREEMERRGIFSSLASFFRRDARQAEQAALEAAASSPTFALEDLQGLQIGFKGEDALYSCSFRCVCVCVVGFVRSHFGSSLVSRHSLGDGRTSKVQTDDLKHRRKHVGHIRPRPANVGLNGPKSGRSRPRLGRTRPNVESRPKSARHRPAFARV